MLSTTGTAADVYPVLVMGAHAYGVVALKGLGAIKPMVRQPGKPDSNDPMGRNGSVAWNTWFASKILNDAWIVRLECAAEENPV
jgi:N4-gp56 family major capsid protein